MPVSDTSPDIQLWTAAAGGGNALVRASGDPDFDSEMTGYQIMQFYQNTVDNALTTSIAEGLFRANDVVFDTVHGKFFVADSDSAGHNRVLQGNITDLVAGNPPALTVLYQDTGSGTATRIDNLEVDPDHGLVYFTHGQRLEKVGYDAALQTPTILANFATGNPNGSTNNFIDDFTVDFAAGSIYLSSHRVTASASGDIVSKNYIYAIHGLTPGAGANAFTFAGGQISLLPFSPDDDDSMPNGTAAPGEAFPQENGTLEGLALSPDGSTLYFATGSTLFDSDGDGDDGSGGGTAPVTLLGGIYAYALTGNAAGTFTLIYQQVAGSGPQGLLDDLEIDFKTGTWYVTDTTGGTSAPGDEGIWRGSLSGGTPTFFANASNGSGLTPGGLVLDHAPELTGTETGATATETAGPNSGFSTPVIVLTGISASDFDTAGFAAQLAGATVRISTGFGSAPGSAEQLTINGTTSGTLASGISYNYAAGTGILTLTGAASAGDYAAALSLVAYAISGDNPDAGGAAPTRTLAYAVSDGLLVSDDFTATVHVAGTNDAPVDTVGGPVSGSEDAASIPITGLSVSDPDSTTLSVTLHVDHGTLAIDAGVAGGVGAGSIGGNGSATVTLSGTQAQLNATLGAATGVAYTPAPDFNGPDTLTMTSSDGSATDSDTVTLNIAAVNDAPTVAGDGTESAAPIVEDMPSAIGQSIAGLFSGQYSDATDQVPGGSSADAFAGVAVTANGSGATGQWQYYNGSAWVDIGPASDGAAILLAAGTSIRFNPAPDFNGAAPTLTAHLVDASGGALTSGAVADLSATGGTTRYSSGTVVLSETVTADNDAPVNHVGGPVSTSEDAVSVPITGLSVTDVDSPSLTVTLSVGRGTLAIDTGVSGGVSAGQVAGNGTGSVTITGNQAQIDATLAAATGVAYTPTHNLNGPDTLTMTSSDGSASDTDTVAINVAAVNDAPTVAGDGTESAAPILQDMPSATGQSVASLFGGQYSDAADQVAGGSSADPFAGVAVTANGSGPAGQWQYYNGSAWVNIGAASDGAAVLLDASTSIRFNPAAGFNGAAPTLTTHLVDGSAGGLASGAIVDASITGGITRYSGGTVLLSETVIATNAPPTGVTGTLAVSEDAANGTVVGTLHATDPDSSTFTYTLVNDAGGRFDINPTTGVVTVENGLLLDYEQAHSQTIRVQVDDHEGGVSQFNVNVAINDVHGEFVIGDSNGNTFYGGAETDILLGSHGADVIHGGGGIDIITGGNGILDSSDAADMLYGEAGNDLIDGNGGDDVIAGGADSDVLVGEDGNDTIFGGASASDATETGNDVISGDNGNDILYGNGGNDTLFGGNDNDQLFGGAGADTLDGGSGNDVLNGGAGADTLTGGSGNDVFVFHKGEANGDVVTDFNGNGAGLGDSIRLEGYAAGTTFTRVGHSDSWKINDHGFVEFVTLQGSPAVHPTDIAVVP